MTDNITIPNDRKDVGSKSFKQKLQERKATSEQTYHEKYQELKYNIIWVLVCVGMPIAACLLCVASVQGWLEVKRYCMWYIQALLTLYIGSLLAKD